MRTVMTRLLLFGFSLTYLVFSLDPTSSMALKRLDLYQIDKPAGANKSAQIKTDPDKPVFNAISPYEIASFITASPDADLKNLWIQLGIRSLNFGYDSISEDQQGAQIDRFLSKCNYCDVETYSCELDGEQGKEVLLKLSDLLAESCRYLVFKQIKRRGTKPEWRLLGHIDHGFGRYKMPEHYIVSGNTYRNWLAVKVQEGSGSGFAEYHDRLFQVDSTGLKEILRFPSEGRLSTCCSYPTRDFTAQIIKGEIKNNVTSVELEFAVSYSAYPGGQDGQLWKKRQKAIYRSDPSSPRLVLDTTKSNLSEDEINAIYGSDGGLSNEDFIKYNYEELSKIALSREDNRRVWLGMYLSQCEESPQVERLRQLIKH